MPLLQVTGKESHIVLDFVKKALVVVNSIPLDETGMSFGVSLPLGGFYSAANVAGYSNLNLGIELGERGVNTDGLVRERFWTIRIGLSLNDLWFIKRQYN